MKLPASFVTELIERARFTPYFHLAGYMERYWLVPYRYLKWQNGSYNGTGPVSFRHRPVAWLLQHLGIAARIHHILRSDAGRDFHDHPWPYITIILRGGYHEVTPVFDRSGIYRGEQWQWFPPGSVIFRRATHWHRLEIPHNETCWTLFITGPKVQEWGFMRPQHVKVPWEQYVEEEGV